MALSRWLTRGMIKLVRLRRLSAGDALSSHKGRWYPVWVISHCEWLYHGSHCRSGKSKN
jgi:hypothetical protein